MITIKKQGVEIDHNGCILCVGCAAVCPVNAIELRGTRMDHFPEKCIDCTLCVKACPANVIRMRRNNGM